MHLFWYRLQQSFLAERQRWWLWYPVLFATGIGLYFLLPFEPSKWITLLVIEAMLLSAFLFRHHLKVLYVLMLLGLVVLGFTSIELRTLYLDGKRFPVPQDKLYVQARVIKSDYNSKGNPRLIIDNLRDFDENKIPGKFRISYRDKQNIFQSGDCVEMVVKLLPLAPASLPGGYQYDRKSFFLGLSGSGYADSRVLGITCLQTPTIREKIGFYIEKIRTDVITHIKSILPPDEASVAAAIIAGEQGGISSELINHYRNSGLAHFLSISGLHMSMITGLMFFLVRFLMALIPPLALRYNSKKIAAWFAILISLIYLLISGNAVPAQRAFIMTLIVLLGVLLDRQAISMYTVALAALVVLLINPEVLIGASFQMSFAAVIALIAFYEKFSGKLQHFLDTTSKQIFIIRALKIIVLYVVGILVSDLVASLATLPFSIYHFNQIALLTSLANLLAGPIIGLVIMPFTLLSLLLMPLGLDELSLKIVGFGIHWVNEITAWVSSMPNANMPVLSPPLWGLIAMVLGGLWLCLWQGKIRLLGMLGILGGIFSFCFIKVPDILINSQGDLIALKDNYGQIVIMPHRGDAFTKKIWLDKTASKTLSKKQYAKLRKIYKGQKQDKNWIDLECQKQECVYRNIFKFSKSGKFILNGKELSLREEDGNKAIFLPNQIYSVKDISGLRPWNKKIRN